MSRKEELSREEEAGWVEFGALLARLRPEQMIEPYNEDGWTVKDLLWHLGCWTAEACRQLERIRMGTYEAQDWDTDRLNAEFLETSRGADLDAARAESISARNRLLQEWDAMAEITPDAEEWFGESSTEHYDEHMPALREWVEKVSALG